MKYREPCLPDTGRKQWPLRACGVSVTENVSIMPLLDPLSDMKDVTAALSASVRISATNRERSSLVLHLNTHLNMGVL